jgi:S1-C subfamily serine protease
MEQMKKAGLLLIAAILGGVISLIGYNSFSSPSIAFDSEIVTYQNIPANYIPTVVRDAAENTNFTVAADKTINAVVHIKNTGIVSSPSSIWDYFNGAGNMHRTRIGMGSGVIVSPDGYIITNNHVIEDSKQLEVKTNDNKVYEAELVGTDPSTDIAVLKILDAKKKLLLCSVWRFRPNQNWRMGTCSWKSF